MIIADHEHHSELGTSPATESTIQSDSDGRYIGTKRGDSGTTWRELTEHQVAACASSQRYLTLLSVFMHGKRVHVPRVTMQATYNRLSIRNPNSQEQQQTSSAVKMVKPGEHQVNMCYTRCALPRRTWEHQVYLCLSP